MSYFNESFNYRAEELQRDCRRAQARDRQIRKKSRGDGGDASRSQDLDVQSNEWEGGSELAVVAARQTSEMRDAYSEHIIRRTPESKLWTGESILKLPIYREERLSIQLSGSETCHLEALLASMETPSDIGYVKKGEVRELASLLFSLNQASDYTFQRFYLAARRALTHPGLNPSAPFSLPRSPEDWDRNPTAKLSALCGVIRRHLSEDGLALLSTNDDGDVVYGSKEVEYTSATTRESRILKKGAKHSDKIVVFVAFPSNYPLIHKARSFKG